VESFCEIRKEKSYWNVVCSCGSKFIVIGRALTSGNTKSCGCLRKEITSERFAKHLLCKTATYTSWANLIQRCTNINSSHYKDYGGRGITICEKWLTFTGFYEDMGDRPEGMSLDRKDNDGNYNKENCKWSTQKEQCNNKRSNHMMVYRGKTQTLGQWADELGMEYSTLNSRVNRSKWSIGKALSQALLVECFLFCLK